MQRPKCPSLISIFVITQPGETYLGRKVLTRMTYPVHSPLARDLRPGTQGKSLKAAPRGLPQSTYLLLCSSSLFFLH